MAVGLTLRVNGCRAVCYLCISDKVNKLLHFPYNYRVYSFWIGDFYNKLHFLISQPVLGRFFVIKTKLIIFAIPFHALPSGMQRSFAFPILSRWVTLVIPHTRYPGSVGVTSCKQERWVFRLSPFTCSRCGFVVSFQHFLMLIQFTQGLNNN